MDFGPEPNLMPEPPAMDNQQPPMMPDENMGPDMGNNADLDGEDEMDPKKSIQKQTGKLASELRNYLGEADPSDANETATWALKMINSAGSNVLNANSKKSIIKALKDGGMEDEGGDDMGNGMNDNMNDNGSNGNPPLGESIEMGISEEFGNTSNSMKDRNKMRCPYTSKEAYKSRHKNSPFS